MTTPWQCTLDYARRHPSIAQDIIKRADYGPLAPEHAKFVLRLRERFGLTKLHAQALIELAYHELERESPQYHKRTDI